jgi:hypothetical protein
MKKVKGMPLLGIGRGGRVAVLVAVSLYGFASIVLACTDGEHRPNEVLAGRGPDQIGITDAGEDADAAAAPGLNGPIDPRMVAMRDAYRGPRVAAGVDLGAERSLVGHPVSDECEERRIGAGWTIGTGVPLNSLTFSPQNADRDLEVKRNSELIVVYCTNPIKLNC